MKQETRDYIDKVACIANANMAYQQFQSVQQRNGNETGMALLMSAFLEMYEHWQSARPGSEPPSDRVYIAADTCVLMRTRLQAEERYKWSDEAEGLFQIMTAFMFLFKYMYLPKY